MEPTEKKRRNDPGDSSWSQSWWRKESLRREAKF